MWQPGAAMGQAMLLVLVGVLLRLWSSIYEAVLIGLQRSYAVQIVQFLQASLFVGLAVTLPQSGVVVRLAAAYASSYLLELGLILLILTRLDPLLVKTLPTLEHAGLRKFLADLRPYAFVEVSLLAREPLKS